VLVVDTRMRITDLNILRELRDGTLEIAETRGHAISRLSVMPDHLHASLRGPIDVSPATIAVGYQIDLDQFINQGRIWSDGFYVGTLGEYTTHAIRKQIDR
jgi:REP element-mobilizing transposase RayT